MYLSWGQLQKYLYLKVFKYIFKIFVFVFNTFNFSHKYLYLINTLQKYLYFQILYKYFIFLKENCYNYNQYIHDIYKHMYIHSQTEKE